MIYVLGGGVGGGKTFAFIVVEYPIGSKCECINGNKTLKAKNTDGKWAFQVPFEGEWTVRCFDGTDYESSTNKRNQTIQIGTEGQSVSVKLSYRTYLIKDGVDITEETGGWEILHKGNSAPTFGTENGAFWFKPTYGSGVAKIATSKPINLASYSNIFFDAQGVSASAIGALYTELNNSSTYLAGSIPIGTTRDTVFIEITETMKEKPLYVALGDKSTSGIAYFYNIWAE